MADSSSSSRCDSFTILLRKNFDVRQIMESKTGRTYLVYLSVKRAKSWAVEMFVIVEYSSEIRTL